MSDNNVPVKKFYSQIRLPFDPVAPMEAATMGFVERQRDFIPLSAASDLQAGKNYILKTADDFTLPANMPEGKSICLIAIAQGTRVVANGNHITSLAVGANLTLSANNYVCLTAVSEGQVAITDFSIINNNASVTNSRYTIVTGDTTLSAGIRYAVTTAANCLVDESFEVGNQLVVTALAGGVLLTGTANIQLVDAEQNNTLPIEQGSHVTLLCVAEGQLQIIEITRSVTPTETDSRFQVLTAGTTLSVNRKYALLNNGTYVLPTMAVGDSITIFTSATDALLENGGNRFTNLDEGDDLALERNSYLILVCLEAGKVTFADIGFIPNPVTGQIGDTSGITSQRAILLTEASQTLLTNNHYVAQAAGDYALPDFIEAGDYLSIHADDVQIRLTHNGKTIKRVGAGNDLIIPPGFLVTMRAISSTTYVIGTAQALAEP